MLFAMDAPSTAFAVALGSNGAHMVPVSSKARTCPRNVGENSRIRNREILWKSPVLEIVADKQNAPTISQTDGLLYAEKAALNERCPNRTQSSSMTIATSQS